MDQNQNPKNALQIPAPASAMHPAICPQCHLPVLPEYYFCPNCGKQLEEPPLPTGLGAQIWLYFFSLIIMPITCYLIYKRWQGVKYFKSQDPKAHRMGIIAIGLLIFSIIFLVWSTIAGTAALENSVQSQVNSVNTLDGY